MEKDNEKELNSDVKTESAPAENAPAEQTATPNEATENLSKAEKKAIERKKNRAEKRLWKERRRIKRGKRALRARKLKNLFFFLTGFILSLVILFGGIFIGAKFVPLNTWTNTIAGGDGDRYIKSDTAGQQSLIDFIMNIGSYRVEDVPVLNDIINDVLTGAGLDGILNVDTDKISGIQFSNVGDGILDAVKISSSLFGDLSELDVFKTVEVPEDKIPSDPAEDFEPKLYYYEIEGEGGAKTYERAFNDDKTRVEASVGKTIVYLSLTDMSLSDMQTLFVPRFKLLSVRSILSTLGGIEEDSEIGQLIGDRTVEEMASFELTEVKLNDILPADDPNNASIYDVLESIYPDKEPTEITVNDLKEFNVKSIKLVSVMPYDEDTNGKLYSILSELTETDKDEITIQKLTETTFDLNVITLDTVMPVEDNEKIYDLLTSVFTGKEATEITIEDLATFDINNVKLVKVMPYDEDTNGKLYSILSELTETDKNEITIQKLTETTFDLNAITLDTVMPVEDNENIYDLLTSVFTGKEATEITIEDLASFDINNVKLVKVMPYDEEKNGNLYKILSELTSTDKNEITIQNLVDADFSIDSLKLTTIIPNDENSADLYGKLSSALGGKAAEDILISDLTSGDFDFNNIVLTDVLPLTTGEGGNEKLYQVLWDMKYPDGDGPTDGEDNPLYSTLTINDLTSFNINNIKLATVMPKNSANEKLYDILGDLTGKTSEDITINDLSTFNVNNIKLTTVMPANENNEKLYDILGDLTGKASGAITINDLSTFNVNNIKLTTVMPVSTANEKLYDILGDLTEKSSDAITISDLSTFNVNNIKLTTVMPVSAANEKLYSILFDMTGKASGAITINDLSTFNVDNIKLTTVMPVSADNTKLYSILFDMTGKAAGAIVISDLSTFNVNNIKLATVLPETENNATLYSILFDMTGKTSSAITINDLTTFSVSNIKLTTVLPENENNAKLYAILVDLTNKSSENITINDLSVFDVKKIKLVTVIDPPTELEPNLNKKLYDIIWDASRYSVDEVTGEITYSDGESRDYDEILLGDLSGEGFDINMVRFSTVLSYDEENIDSMNPILARLVQDKDGVRLGNLDEKINNMRVDALYGIKCFTKNAAYSKDTGAKYTYNEETGVYTFTPSATVTEDNNVYYINGVEDGDENIKAGIWLFVLYDMGAVDGNGYALTYTDKNLKFQNLRGNVGTIGDDIMNATIRQLYISGIFATAYENIMDKTLQGVMEAFNTYMGLGGFGA